MNSVLFSSKNGLLNENKPSKKELLNHNQDVSSRMPPKKLSNNDENNFKASFSNKINALLLKSQKKLANTKQPETINEPISPSSISSSSASPLSISSPQTIISSPLSSNSCKISNQNEKQAKTSSKDEDSSACLDSNITTTTNENLKSDNSQSIDLVIKNESNLEAADNDKVENSPSIHQLIKEENFESSKDIVVGEDADDDEGEEEKAEETLVIDLKEEHIEKDSANDLTNGNELKNEENTQLTVKEALNVDLNNSKSSSSTNETTLSTKVNTRDKHVCRYCSKSFPRSANLTRHLRTHTGTLIF